MLHTRGTRTGTVTHVASVSHEGKVVIVATVAGDSGMPLEYTARQDGFEDTALAANARGGPRTGWEEFKTLPLPAERDDESVVERERKTLRDPANGAYLMRSAYRTADSSADIAVQLVSHDGHVYVFRQSTAHQLLVDRFVLDGLTNTLTPKLEVRYKRSRQRYTAAEDMKISGTGKEQRLDGADSFDFRDVEGHPFFEPTTVVCERFVGNVKLGRFAVIVTPTVEAGTFRWHVAVVSGDSTVTVVSIRSGATQIFDVTDERFRWTDSATVHPRTEHVPGVIVRTIDLRAGGNALTITGAPAMVTYDVQHEADTDAGTQLVRDASKVLLTVPTDRGVAALSFAIGLDGTLAQIGPMDVTPIIAEPRAVAMPNDVLDTVRALGAGRPMPAGGIAEMSRSEDADTVDRVRIRVANASQLDELGVGDVVRIANTVAYNGLHVVQAVHNVDGHDVFQLDAPFAGDELGNWEKVVDPRAGEVFDGLLTGYRPDDGHLAITAQNVQLQADDSVQIVGHGAYDGEYAVVDKDSSGFTIDRPWLRGEAVTATAAARRLRGLSFDGHNDGVTIGYGKDLNLSRGFTVETWVKLEDASDQAVLTTQPPAGGSAPGSVSLADDWQLAITVENGRTMARLGAFYAGGQTIELASSQVVVPGRWLHVAFTFDGKVLQLLENGTVTAELDAATVTKALDDNRAYVLKGLSATLEYERATEAGSRLIDRFPTWFDGGQLIADGKALTAAAGHGPLSIEIPRSDPAQRWELTLAANDRCVIRNAATGGVLALDPAGHPITVAPNDAGGPPDWRLEVAGDYWWISPRGDNRVLSASGSGIALDAFHNNASELWTFGPYGPRKSERARRNLVAAQRWTSGPRIVPATMQLAVGGGRLAYLHGQLAETRLWDVGRAVRAVRDAMLVPVTSRETGLVGYWKLNGVASTSAGDGQVVDFSVHANHGRVLGAPVVGAVTIPRTLGDGATMVERLAAEDTFAVREGAVYEEAIEFRTEPVWTGEAAPFMPSLWGLERRGGDRIDGQEWLEPSPTVVALPTDGHGDGWFCATWRFRVGDGVRLVRCFEVSAVIGDWTSISLRRHRMTLESASVSLGSANEIADVTISIDATAAGEAAGYLAEIPQLESRERELVDRRRLLRQQLADDNAAQIKKLEDAIVKLKLEIATRIVSLKTHLTSPQTVRPLGVPSVDPLWPLPVCVNIGEVHCNPGETVEAIGFTVKMVGLTVFGLSCLTPMLWCFDPATGGHRWAEPPVVIAPCAYVIDAAPVEIATGRVITGFKFLFHSLDGSSAVGCSPVLGWTAGDGTTGWSFSDPQPEWVSAQTLVAGRPSDNSSAEFPGPLKGFQFMVVGNVVRPVLTWIDIAASNREQADRDRLVAALAASEANLANLKQQTDAEKTAARAELTTVEADLQTVRGSLADRHFRFVHSTAFTTRSRSMPALPGQTDPHGLAVEALLLGDLRPRGPMQALASCTGNVDVTFQDTDGRVRRVAFDASYDADGRGEQWSTGAFRAALDLAGAAPIELPADIMGGLDGQVTIEFWAKGGSTQPYQNDREYPEPVLYALSTMSDNELPRCLVHVPTFANEVAWATRLGNIDDERVAYTIDLSSARGSWAHWAFVKDCDAGVMQIFRNGELQVEDSAKKRADPTWGKERLRAIEKTYLGGGYWAPELAWAGQLAELRVWNVALDANEIEANAASTLTGNEPGLVAYYPFDEGDGPARDRVKGVGRDLAGVHWAACDAPIGQLAGPAAGTVANGAEAVTAEYSRVRVEPNGSRSARMQRVVALPTPKGVHLLDTQRIEDLDMRWIGNAQISPTLIGYIEGAPPVPSENLTEEDDYNGATSVELVESSDVEYSWTREQDASLGATAELFLGVKDDLRVGLAVSTTAFEAKIGAKLNLDFAYHWHSSSTVAASHKLSRSDRIALRGNREAVAHFPEIGPRFIPKNVGYALVTSGIADVYVTRLRRSGRMVGYVVLPTSAGTIDVNTITFLMNPAYTMAGSLDGLTGSQATSDRFFAQVPEMRNRYGSLYPASYFRLQDAYDLKNEIDYRDASHQAYFNQFNAGLVDEWSMSRQIDDGRGAEAALNASGDSTGGDTATGQSAEVTRLQKAVRDKLKEVVQLKKDLKNQVAGVTQQQIDAAETQLDDLREQLDAARENDRASQDDANAQRADKIQTQYDDISDRVNAAVSFASWQRKMEDLQIRAGKRNIVNTYVWDGDGGLHAEEQQFASSVQHSIGGSFELGIAIGGLGEIAGGGAAFDLTAQAKIGLTQTVSKTESTSSGVELHVDLSGVESRGITDFRDTPMLPGEKVDRYRFMSFYLENNAEHWHDFFDHVVDPEWLASNDEEARALRQAQQAQPNKTWRVLHRVTYVERPALMGLGRTASRPVDVVNELSLLRNEVAALRAAQEDVRKTVEDGLRNRLPELLAQLLKPRGSQ